MSNNLLEFGGVADITVLSICDFKHNGINYKKDDVLFNLQQIPISFQYKSLSSEQTAKRTQIYYHEYSLDTSTINVIPFDSNIQRLFSKAAINELKLTTVEQVMAMRNLLIPINDFLVDEYIKIDGVENFEIRSLGGTNVIYSEELQDSNYYTIQYQYKKPVKSFELDSGDVDIPYVKLQIRFVGNEDKKNNESYFIIDKASIHLTPVLNLSGKAVSYIYLMFKIIDGANKPMLAVVDNGY